VVLSTMKQEVSPKWAPAPRVMESCKDLQSGKESYDYDSAFSISSDSLPDAEESELSVSESISEASSQLPVKGFIQVRPMSPCESFGNYSKQHEEMHFPVKNATSAETLATERSETTVVPPAAVKVPKAEETVVGRES